MTTIPSIQTALNAGELSPDLLGRVDLDKYKKGCSTARNMFASYRGGLFSRAGTAFVGQSRQPVTAAPPALIPFQFSVTQGICLELGDNYMSFIDDGGYITETPITMTGIAGGAGNAVFAVVQAWAPGDLVFYAGDAKNPSIDDRIFKVLTATGASVTVAEMLTGAPILAANLAAPQATATLARIYKITTPWAAADLPLLKWAQSADVMSLVHPSYPPYDLARITNINWTLTKTTFATSIAAPANVSLSASTSPSGTTSLWYYQYVATAVDAATGEESLASAIGTTSSVNISLQAGTITVNCATVTGAASYNFYRAPPTYQALPIAGNLFGFVGTSLGPSWIDTNIEADFTITPPIHFNPFATASISAINMTSAGVNYSNTASVTVTSATGSGFTGAPVIINGNIEWVIVNYGGIGYLNTDTVVFHDSTGTSASATLNVGPSSGTYPGCVSYFQERRIYANTNNNPDTYYATQPGAFTNMDSSTPSQADDAIIGSPWSQQVNGIQWMLNMPGGLVIFTGSGAWQLSGAGQGLSTTAAITPSSQVAVPQAFNGVSPLIKPIVINYDILYVQEKGSIVRDLAYNFFVNIYTGTDMTVLSNHLFTGHTIVRWDWAEEPNKLLWAVRDDGILLCLTFLKEQDVYAWTRHDTNGIFLSVATVSEPPVNAPYFVVQRLIQSSGIPVWAYYIERMDNRIWADITECWCVDAGKNYAANYPNATLSLSSATGTPTLSQPVVAFGGAHYSGATFAEVIDPTGAGAIVTLTITAGVITAAVASGTLAGYTNPQINIIDPNGTGAGAVINAFSTNVAVVTANAAVFSNVAGAGAAGDVIRSDGATMTVTTFNNIFSLTVNVQSPAVAVVPNDPLNTPLPAPAGDWSIATPIATVYGLNHLEGMTVSILADGNVIQPQTVVNGTVVLPVAASAIIIGLGFTAQMQTMYLDYPAPVTIQGRRKTILGATIRVVETAGPIQVGTNQPDASAQPGNATVPWTNMSPIAPIITNKSPLQAFPLYSGDIYTQLPGDYASNGQVAVQQSSPIPLNIVGVMPWSETGDMAG